MNYFKIAKYFSYLFGFPWLPIIAVAIILIVDAFFPVLLIFILIKLKKISDWDITKREERRLYLSILLFSFLVTTTLVYLFGNQHSFYIFLRFFALQLVLTVTSFFWKISLHASANTAAALFLNLLFSWTILWLFLSIPLICWSRYYFKKYTVSQLITGVLVTFFIVLSSFKFFHLI